LFRGRIKVTSTIALHFDVEYLVRDRGLSAKGPPTGNGIWAIEWSRDRPRHMTLKGKTRDPMQCA